MQKYELKLVPSHPVEMEMVQSFIRLLHFQSSHSLSLVPANHHRSLSGHYFEGALRFDGERSPSMRFVHRIGFLIQCRHQAIVALACGCHVAYLRGVCAWSHDKKIIKRKRKTKQNSFHQPPRCASSRRPADTKPRQHSNKPHSPFSTLLNTCT